MKILTVVGARPQFVKMAPVSRAMKNAPEPIDEFVIHTGQHFDHNMSASFFDELEIREPDLNLGVRQLGHGAMTGRMLEALEREMLSIRPDLTLVYGDTNSTLAGALASAKLHIPVAHVEAGLRSWNRAMPEEINRVLTDHMAALLFCPTAAAVENLDKEGIRAGVHLVGDVMYDAALGFRQKAITTSGALQRLGLRENGYALATIHRAENTDDEPRLRKILASLSALAQTMPVVFPVHPRTQAKMASLGAGQAPANMILTDPVPYLDMIMLESSARLIVTDSGGVQKEAYFFGKPCVTLRSETEWVETVQAGWNRLSEPEPALFMAAVAEAMEATPAWSPIYGDGNCAAKIAEILAAFPAKN